MLEFPRTGQLRQCDVSFIFKSFPDIADIFTSWMAAEPSTWVNGFVFMDGRVLALNLAAVAPAEGLLTRELRDAPRPPPRSN